MLEKLLNKKKLNILSSVPKKDVIKHKNLQIITRQGTKIDHDNTQVTNLRSKDCNYPQINQQKYVINNDSIIFEYITQEEDTQECRNKTLNGLFQLLTK